MAGEFLVEKARLTATEHRLVVTARDFASQAIAPQIDAWEHARQHLPRSLIAAWARLGLNGLQVSEAQGGSGAGFLCKIAVAAELAKIDFAAAFALTNMQGAATRIAREGSPDQARRYLADLVCARLIGAPSLSEPAAGSDFGAIATHARRIDCGWEITGEKAWVTNGAIADLLVMYAQTDPAQGTRGIASFLIDLHAPGITRLPAEILMGGHAIGAAGIRLDAVRVGEDALFAPPGQAFKAGLRGVTAARVHVAAMVCGMVEAALARTVAHAQSRETFGQPLLRHQGLRWQLADVATQLEALKLLTLRAAATIEAGGDAQVEAAFAKKFAGDMATRSIAACMQAMGAEGLRVAHPFGRQLAGARISAYVDGTPEIQNERIGLALPTRY